MSDIVSVARGDGARSLAELEEPGCIEFSLEHGEDAKFLYYMKADQSWIYREQTWFESSRNNPPVLLREICFVVRPGLAAYLFQKAGRPLPPELAESRPLPRWDRDHRTLRYEETLCRVYKRENAGNQFAILDAFESRGWPRSVDSPFKLDRTLRETTDNLNQGLKKAGSLIGFKVEAGKLVWCAFVAPASAG